ncbi:hypothetical protein VKT23_017422 [Stygiomarasmius scandens]|uniref:Fungal-type protein kinase domain-containing protein n=1 Tax=Marasmiellus scandens TaxID=2682957 RepID=A0ABR1IS79_9AGAR
MAHTQYRPIRECRSLEEFKKVFSDAVKAHYYAYNHFKDQPILQTRGLGRNDVFLCCSDKSDEPANGVFHDWDIYSTNDPQNCRYSSPEKDLPNAYGFQPFLALDMCHRQPPTEHLYRHHLESFLYVLFWAALHYHFDGTSKPYLDGAVVSWWGPTRSFSNIRYQKERLFDGRLDRMLEYYGLTPQLRDWLKPVFNLFARAFNERSCNIGKNSWDDSTMGGRLTFERFMLVSGCDAELSAWYDLPFAEQFED